MRDYCFITPDRVALPRSVAADVYVGKPKQPEIASRAAEIARDLRYI